MRPLTWGHGDDLVDDVRRILLVDDIDIVPGGRARGVKSCCSLASEPQQSSRLWGPDHSSGIPEESCPGRRNRKGTLGLVPLALVHRPMHMSARQACADTKGQGPYQ